jgi:hypothetical protein
MTALLRRHIGVCPPMKTQLEFHAWPSRSHSLFVIPSKILKITYVISAIPLVVQEIFNFVYDSPTSLVHCVIWSFLSLLHIHFAGFRMSRKVIPFSSLAYIIVACSFHSHPQLIWLLHSSFHSHPNPIWLLHSSFHSHPNPIWLLHSSFHSHP